MAGTTTVDQLIVKIKADAANYEKVLRKVERQTTKTVQQVEKGTKSIVKKWKTGFNKIGMMSRGLGIKLSLALTLPLLAFGATSVKAFSDFDDAMTKSTAIMSGVTAEIRAEMEKTANSIASMSTKTPKELAESYFFLASAGLDAQQSMGALQIVTDFAIAGAFDMSKATDLLTDAQSALGLTVKDTAQNMANMTRISDVLIKANTLANASAEQFATSLTTKTATALRALNKDVEEGVAVLAIYADQGIKGQLAGERLSIVLRDLQQASQNNTKQWDALGISIHDTNGDMKPMVSIIRDLEKQMEGLSDKQKMAKFQMLGFQFRSISAIKSLIGMSDKIEDYEKKLRSAGGTTKEVAERQLKSFAAQMTILKNKITIISTEIGSVLAPILTKLAEYVAIATVWWGNLGDATKKFIVFTAVLVGALGPLLLMIGFIAPLIAPIIAGIALAATTVGGWAAAIGTTVAAFAPFITVINVAIAAIVSFSGILSPIFSIISSAFSAVASVIGAVVGAVVSVIGTLVGVIVKFATSIITKFQPVINILLMLAKAVATVVGAFLWLAGSAIVGTINAIAWAISGLIEVVASTVGWVADLAMTFSGLNFVIAVVKDIDDAMVVLREDTESYNEALERSVELNDKLTARIKKKNSETVAGIEGAGNPIKAQEQATKELVIARKNLKGYEDGVKAAELEVEQLGGIIASVFGSKEVEQAEKGVAEANARLEQQKQLIKDIGEVQKENAPKIRKFKEEEKKKKDQAVTAAEAQKVADLQNNVDKLNESLKLKSATLGMTSKEIAIYKLKLQGATEEQLEMTRSLHAGIEVQEKFFKGKSIIDSLDQQIITFGMTADEIQLYKAKLDGINPIQLKTMEIQQKTLADLEKSKAYKEHNKDLIDQIKLIGLEGVALEAAKMKQEGFTQSQIAATMSILEMKAIKEQAAEASEYETSLQNQIELIGLQGTALEIAKLKQQGFTDAQAAAAKIILVKKKALENDAKIMKKGKDLIKQYRSPMDVFIDKQKELKEMLDKGAIDTDTYTKALNDAEKQSKKDMTVKLGVTGIEDVEAGSAAALASMQEFLTNRPDDFNVDGKANLTTQQTMLADSQADTKNITAKSATGKKDGTSWETDVLTVLGTIATNTATSAFTVVGADL